MATTIHSARSLIADIAAGDAIGDDRYVRRKVNNLHAVIGALQLQWARRQRAANLLDDEAACAAALEQIQREIDDVKARIAVLGKPTLVASLEPSRN